MENITAYAVKSSLYKFFQGGAKFEKHKSSEVQEWR